MTAFPVPRRVTELTLDPVSSAEPRAASPARSGPLADWRGASGYVLLGEPGSGKTTAFEMECDADPESGERFSARDFAALDVDSRPEWRGKTLFIDGLDEMRTASRDWRRASSRPGRPDSRRRRRSARVSESSTPPRGNARTAATRRAAAWRVSASAWPAPRASSLPIKPRRPDRSAASSDRAFTTAGSSDGAPSRVMAPQI